MSFPFKPDIPLRSGRRWIGPALFAAIVILLAAGGLVTNLDKSSALRESKQASRRAPAQPASAVAPLNLVRPLTPEEAIKLNEEKPFNAPPDSPAKAFNLRTDENSRDRALECLTQAVYYEAATEGAEGQRAVAQVVLNRMRHPGFPSSVCGVVYQGSQLPTGCQFTFTCDGSLTRAPIPSIWSQARKIAGEALAGKVFAPVGHSTHYHANYVVPYWADSLAKQVQVGQHIFYRLQGSLGSSGAFSQRYAGREPELPTPPSSLAVAVEATDQAEALLNSGLAGDRPPTVAADAAGIAAAGQPKQVLLADTNKSALLIDGDAGPAPPPKRKQQTDCSGPREKRVKPASPTDLRAGASIEGC